MDLEHLPLSPPLICLNWYIYFEFLSTSTINDDNNKGVVKTVQRHPWSRSQHLLEFSQLLQPVLVSLSSNTIAKVCLLVCQMIDKTIIIVSKRFLIIFFNLISILARMYCADVKTKCIVFMPGGCPLGKSHESIFFAGYTHARWYLNIQVILKMLPKVI